MATELICIVCYSLVFGARFIFSNNSFFLTAAVVRGEAVGDLVSQLPLTAVHHVMVEVPGFQIMGTAPW